MSVKDKLYTAVESAYQRTIRPHLPRRLVNENGVDVRRPKLFDTYNGCESYEAALVAGVQTVVQSRDHVAVVGGGWGVSSVHAARAGAEMVDVYEPGDGQFQHLTETVRRNGVVDRVRLHHAIVGKAVSVYGDTTADVLAPNEVPPVDVLVLDCEGAEFDILDGLADRPRAVVVEVHPHLGVSHRAITDQLNEMGYYIVNVDVEDADRHVVVFTARKR